MSTLVAVMVAVVSAEVAADRPLAWSLYGHTGAAVYVSSSRLIGGEGGGLGVQLSRGLFVVEAELGLRVGLGTVVDAQLAVGIQRPGGWAPAALLALSMLAGEETTVLNDEHPMPVRSPAFSIGLKLEPLRFVHERIRLSVIQLGVGVGSDFPGAGLFLRVTFMELGIALPPY